MKEGRVVLLDIDQVRPNPAQPRKHFDEVALRQLAESIRSAGVLQPVIVRKDTEGEGYLLIMGERRFRASRSLGLKQIPAIIKEGPVSEELKLALIENIQRSDLNIIEEGLAYQALLKEHHLSQEALAVSVGKDRSSIANALRVLTLPQKVQADLIAGSLTAGHAKALLMLKTPEDVLMAAEFILKQDLSVRRAEKLCRDLVLAKSASTVKKEEKSPDANLAYLSSRLRSSLRTKVRIQGSKERGRIEVHYYSMEELERLIGLFP